MNSAEQKAYNRITRQVGFGWFRLRDLRGVSAADFWALEELGLVRQRTVCPIALRMENQLPSLQQFRMLG